MNIKRTTMLTMPTKTTKSHQQIFDRTISPVVDKLMRICDQNGIAMQFTAQLRANTAQDKIVTESLYTNESHPLFPVIDKLSRGKLTILELADGDFYLRISDVPDMEAHEKAVISSLPFVVPFTGIIH